MNAASITLRLAAGVAMGAFFYGTLWLIVRRLPTARHPVLLTLGGFWVRLITVLAGFFLLMQGRWEYAAMCLAGFMAGRFAVSRLLRAKPFTAGSAESAGDAGKANNARIETGNSSQTWEIIRDSSAGSADDTGKTKKSALIRANPR